MGKKLSLDTVKERVNKNSGGFIEFIDTEYIHKDQPHSMRCLKGHVFKRSYNNSRQTKTCPECHKRYYKKTLEQYAADLKKACPTITVVGDYSIDRNPVRIRYECGCETTRVAGRLLSGFGTSCPKHSEGYQNKMDRHTAEKRLKSLPFSTMRINQDIFLGATEKTKFICENCNAEDEVTLLALINRDGKCNSCSRYVKSINEEFLALCLKDLGIGFIREYKLPSDNRPFDFYIKGTKTLIEYDGVQHDKLENIAIDLRKEEFAKSLGYNVVRIKHNESIISKLAKLKGSTTIL